MISQSPNIVIVCYLSGLRGQAVDHIINMSPDMVGKPKRLHAGDDGSLHDHPGPLGMLPNGQPLRLYWEGTAHGIEDLLATARTSQGMPLSEALSLGKISGTSLLPPSTIREILPNAITIGLTWNRRWYRAVRDAGTKLWTQSTDTDNNIGKYLRWQSKRLGQQGGDWVSIHSRMCDDPGITRKQYMRLESAELIDFQSNAAMQADYVCDLGRLFGNSSSEEYLSLCEACGITPVPDLSLPWIRGYLGKQWVR